MLEKLRRNNNSQFGRDHVFANIRRGEDFRRELPIIDYDYHRDYIEGVKQGDVLTRASIKLMALNLDFSIDKVKTELGYQPKVDFQRGIAETLE